MGAVTWVWVALGAACGAPARFLLDRAVCGRWPARFPIGTFVVNVLGSLALGVLAGAAAHGGASAGLLLVAGVGFCGTFTTYSTFAWETLALVESGATRAALGNVLGSAGAALTAAALGVALGGRLLT